ncbi:MAG: hypothetical protein U0893_17395 [Chloroflexota bacterium]
MMSLRPQPRVPARLDDELALDRPTRAPWRDVQPDDRDEPPAPAERVIVSRRAAAPSPLDSLSRGIGLLLKLTLLLILLAILWGVVSLIGAGIRAPAAIGDQIGGALERGAGLIGAAGQHVADAFDPSHPPRQALAQDVEIDQLLRVDVGSQVVGSATREITLASVQRRADPSGPDGAVYAVLHAELREPQETKVLGVTVRSTRDPKDVYLYRGETIRIGRALYKVNWVSVERQQLALVAYRDQDRVTASLKAELD